MSLSVQFQASMAETLSKAFPGVSCPSKVIFNKLKSEYQWPGAVQVSRLCSRPVADITKEVAAQFSNRDVEVSVSGNLLIISFKVDSLTRDLDQMHRDPRLGVSLPEKKQRVIVEFSSPNVAKELHVGHMRSTIIGESLSRTIEFMGHDVLRLNHIGDWGTQFGMLLHYIEVKQLDVSKLDLAQLMKCYRDAKTEFDAEDKFKAKFKEAFLADENLKEVLNSDEAFKKKMSDDESLKNKFDSINSKAVRDLHKGNAKDKEIWKHVCDVCNRSFDKKVDLDKNFQQQFEASKVFKEKSRHAVVGLQSGDPKSKEVWLQICEVSRKAYNEIYKILDITLTERGESYYNPMLATVVKDLLDRGIAVESDGAICAFVEGEEVPFMLKKSDGGYGYDTTDAAAMKQRTEVEKANRIVVVVDAGQSLHFELLKKVSQKAGYLPATTEFRHVEFGVVLGADGKKFKSRSGDTVGLNDFLQESIEKAKKVFFERRKGEFEKKIEAGNSESVVELAELQKTGLSETDKEAAQTLGIGALKYADLKNARQSDYSFDPEKMLKFEGDTIAFLMYSLVRIRSIIRQAGKEIGMEPFSLNHPTEKALGLHLRRFEEVLREVEEKLEPHHLCGYLYELAAAFNRFYTSCNVRGDAQEASRLRLCDLTAKVQTKGLYLLGIKTLDRM